MTFSSSASPCSWTITMQCSRQPAPALAVRLPTPWPLAAWDWQRGPSCPCRGTLASRPPADPSPSPWPLSPCAPGTAAARRSAWCPRSCSTRSRSYSVPRDSLLVPQWPRLQSYENSSAWTMKVGPQLGLEGRLKKRAARSTSGGSWIECRRVAAQRERHSWRPSWKWPETLTSRNSQGPAQVPHSLSACQAADNSQ